MGMQGIEVLSEKLEEYFKHATLEKTEDRIKREIAEIDIVLVEQSYFIEKKMEEIIYS